MRLDEFVATRLVETQVHGMDLTDALGRNRFPCQGSRRWRPRCWTRSWPAGPSPAVRLTLQGAGRVLSRPAPRSPP
jgi:hypothetical protein